jgi:IstB-like ATP binding protein
VAIPATAAGSASYEAPLYQNGLPSADLTAETTRADHPRDQPADGLRPEDHQQVPGASGRRTGAWAARRTTRQAQPVPTLMQGTNAAGCGTLACCFACCGSRATRADKPRSTDCLRSQRQNAESGRPGAEDVYHEGQIQELHSLRFIHLGEEYGFLGPPGVGKMHLLVTLAEAALPAGFGF